MPQKILYHGSPLAVNPPPCLCHASETPAGQLPDSCRTGAGQLPAPVLVFAEPQQPSKEVSR